MIVVRSPESIYQAHGTIQDGTFQGLPGGAKAVYPFPPRHGGYLYVLEGGPVTLGAAAMPALAAAMITGETGIAVSAADDAELLLVDVLAA